MYIVKPNFKTMTGQSIIQTLNHCMKTTQCEFRVYEHSMLHNVLYIIHSNKIPSSVKVYQIQYSSDIK